MPRRHLFAIVTLAAPVLVLLSLEGGLRVAGFGESFPLFVPVEEAPSHLRANPEVVRRFVPGPADAPRLWIRPVFFPRDKGPGTFRIFVQGGSTAAGYPYGYGASPAGMLQQRLQRTFPKRRIEVVTTAMSAVGSYTLLDFTGEILDRDPDAVLIYAGHNEYVGILGVGSGLSVGRLRPVVLSFLAVRELRIFQLLQRALAALRPSRGANQEARGRRSLMATIVAERRIPYGSPLYLRGVAQYRANLRAILRRYRSAGVPVFIATLVSNERDQAPFRSANAPGADAAAWARHHDAGWAALASGDPHAALAAFDRAVAIDDAHAHGHFARGRALERLGRHPEARRAYLAAKDRDQLRFRAPEAMNQVIRELAAEQGAHVVEVQEAFATAAWNGIVGEDLMLEHLHPNLRGYFLLADAFYQALQTREMIAPWERPIPREKAWREIPVTEVERLYGEHRIRQLTADWPFREHRTEVRLPPPRDRIESIAASYFQGRLEWPAAMRGLLDHYRAAADDREAAKVAVLLAEAFPYDAEQQWLAHELLLRARRPEAEVYAARATELDPEAP